MTGKKAEYITISEKYKKNGKRVFESYMVRYGNDINDIRLQCIKDYYDKNGWYVGYKDSKLVRDIVIYSAKYIDGEARITKFLGVLTINPNADYASWRTTHTDYGGYKLVNLKNGRLM